VKENQGKEVTVTILSRSGGKKVRTNRKEGIRHNPWKAKEGNEMELR